MKIIKKIQARYAQSLGLRNIFHNIGWLFFDKILRMGVGLVVGVWIARYLGPEQYGTWNYAIAFTSLFGAFATLGLDNIVVRDIVQYPLKRDEILGSAFVLRLLAGTGTLLLTVISISYIKSGDTLSIALVALSSVGFIFQSVYVIDFYFQSQVMSKYTVYASNTAFICMAAVKVACILFRYPLIAFAIVGAAEVLFGSLLLAGAYRYNKLSLFHWRFNTDAAKKLLKDSWPLLLSGLSVMVYMRIDQVMIGSMLGDEEVGIYSAAVKLSEMWYFIPAAIVGSLFPAIIQSKKKSEELYYARLQKLFDVMAWVSITVALAMTFTSEWIVQALYGSGFAKSSSVLTLHIWAGIPVCLGLASASWFMTENLQRLFFYRTLIGAVINVVLNIVLIPLYGIIGAAVATIIAQSFVGIIVDVQTEKTRKLFFMKLKSLSLLSSVRKRMDS